MIFTQKCSQLLESMRIDPNEFSASLLLTHGKDASYFNDLINKFFDYGVKDLTTECFNGFIQNFCFDDDSLIFNQMYDLFNYLRLYREGGAFKLFKGRQAEWGGPKIIIVESDVPPWDSGKLNEPITVYRGMSKAEYDSGKFGQSWTIQQTVAQRFATSTYSDIKLGIVVKAIICLESVLYYDSQDFEEEIIVMDGSVTTVDVVQYLYKNY